MMEKGDNKDGEDLLPDLNQVKEQIERERSVHINRTFKLRCVPSGTTHATHHHFLAITRRHGKPNNGRTNKKLSSRNVPPVHYYNEKRDVPYDEITFPIPDEEVTELPFVEQLPRSTTWVFTNRNQLMAESDSVLGKKQIHYVDGEAVELSSNNKEDEEEAEKELLEFSKDVDRFIWEIGQEHSLDDPVVQSALSKFLEVDVSDILERYDELNKLKNEVSDQSRFTNFSETADRRFCRRCLIFDCHMHEEYQPMPNTRENQSNLFESEDVRKQCSQHCYLELRSVTEVDYVVDNDNSISNKTGKNVVSSTNTETGDCVLTDPNEVIKDITEMSQAHNEWTPLEKDIYLQGVKIFGRNSCLITRNLLCGRKTCLEVYKYMCEHDQCDILLEHNETSETDSQVNNKEISRKKTRLVRRKARLQKYACYPAAIKNTAKETNKSYKQYTPCTCEPICGDQCSCLISGNCCEKYCGCLKTCKNRFGGCICAKGQCINRQCPCFAASRECDPDLCRNCLLSCGDDSLGETSQPSQCKNMRFLLQKHKRILIARSDVHGWGAFTRYSLKKKEFLGEYTGELVSHEEANERGRADDKLGFSYLFTLNDKLVIDARRKGNKFKFLNHSSTPNCYAKLMIVRGDHRIGLFASKAIEAGDELFFDYCYGPGQAAWSNDGKPRKSGGPKLKGISPSS